MSHQILHKQVRLLTWWGAAALKLYYALMRIRRTMSSCLIEKAANMIRTYQHISRFDKRPGLEWVSKRLSCAHALRVSTDKWQGLAVAMKQGLSRVGSLHELEIAGGAPEEGDATLAHMMSLLWLLASAPNLRLFSAALGSLPWFPPLSHVKHFVLSLEEDMTAGNVFAALLLAENLETLSLKSVGDVLEVPLLRLESLPRLHSVGLNGIRPDGTSLPPECTLHLEGLKEADFTCAKWDSALHRVGSFYFHDTNLKITHQIPAFFARLQNINAVNIWVAQLGTSEEYLHLDALSHVQSLLLVAQALYLTVPSKVSWRQMMLLSEGEMGLSFDDPVWFAKKVPKVTVKYASLVGPSLFEVTGVWAAEKTRWGPFSYRRSQTVISCGSSVLKFTKCGCGACMPCLRAALVAHEHLREEVDPTGDESDTH